MRERERDREREREKERERTRERERETERERERKREREREGEPFAWVFKRYLSTHMLFARVFKGYHLKPMRIITYAGIKILKPMLFASTCLQKTEKNNNLC